MLFSSLVFILLFLPLTLLFYYVLPKRLQNMWLLCVSLFFYAWGEPVYVFLMLVTTLYIWAFGILIGKYRKENRKGPAKFFLILSLVLSLCTLAYFKYFGFIVENLPFLQDTVLANLKPALPIGISFYTFQALSYVIDVYRGTVAVQKNWIDFAMYISFFPQLIAGPIVRYTDIAAQLKNRVVTLDKFTAGIRRFCVGLGKKVLLANQIGMLWDTVASYPQHTTVGAWLGAIAFSFQIYFDFSAYSDMAIGLGKMFGFELTENFKYPYESKSVTEFWRRWHMTLGTWFREYVYIPLGGNRVEKGRLVFNLFVVWALTGLWHGAAYQFILWGIYYFVFLVLEKFVLQNFLPKLAPWFRHVMTMLVVVLGWVMFAAADLNKAGELYRAMFGGGLAFISHTDIFLFSSYALLLLLCAIGATKLPSRIANGIHKRFQSNTVDYIYNFASLAILWVSIAFLMEDGYNPFLYFRF